MAKPISEFCLVAFILGVLGLFLPPFALLTIIFGVAGLKHSRREQLAGRGLAVAGMLCAIVGLLAFSVLVMWGFSFLKEFLATIPSRM